jgi:hypothetical protein
MSSVPIDPSDKEGEPLPDGDRYVRMRGSLLELLLKVAAVWARVQDNPAMQLSTDSPPVVTDLEGGFPGWIQCPDSAVFTESTAEVEGREDEQLRLEDETLEVFALVEGEVPVDNDGENGVFNGLFLARTARSLLQALTKMLGEPYSWKYGDHYPSRVAILTLFCQLLNQDADGPCGGDRPRVVVLTRGLLGELELILDEQDRKSLSEAFGEAAGSDGHPDVIVEGKLSKAVRERFASVLREELAALPRISESRVVVEALLSLIG